MPTSLEQTRRTVKANTRALGKSLELTIKVKVYDNGMIEVFGVPANDDTGGYDAGAGWLTTAEDIMLALGEFRRQAVARRRSAQDQGGDQ